MSSVTIDMATAAIGGMLKNVYSKVRENVVPLATPLFAEIKKGVKGGNRGLKWGGNGVYFNAVVTRPVGMTASAGGNLPPSSVAREVQGKFDIKRLYVTREVDALALTGTASGEASYKSLALKITEEMKDAIQFGMQEFSHGDGRGVKGVITTVTSNTQIVVTSPYGITGAGQGGLWLDEGMYVAVRDTTGATLRGKALISTVTNSGDSATLVLASAISGMAPTDILVLATVNDDSYNAYPDGLISITNRGGSYATHANISSSTNPRWDAVRMVAGVDTPDVDYPSEFDIWELVTRVAARSGKDAKLNPGDFLLLTTPGLERKFAEQFFGQRTIPINQMMDLKGGFKGMSFHGIGLISDGHCPAGTVYLVHKPSLTWIDGEDWGAVSQGGSDAWRFISGKDAYQTSFRAYLQLGTTFRSAHGSITGYTDTGRYTLVV